MSQQRIIAALVERVRADGNPLARMFEDASPSAIARQLFMNARRRGDACHGLRLTTLGLQLMKTYFQCYEVEMVEGHKVRPQHLLYLDRRATLPYYYADRYLVSFDREMGMLLKLAEGNFDVVMAMDPARRRACDT